MNNKIDTTVFDKLLEFRKERKSSMAYDIVSYILILTLWYQFNNRIFAIIYLIVYILSVIGYARELNYINDEIKNTLARMEIQRIKNKDDDDNCEKVCIKILDDLKKELCGVVDDENIKNYIKNRIDGLILRIK